MQGKTLQQELKSLVKQYDPMFVWVFELRVCYELNYYYNLYSHTFHKNILFIRSDIVKNRCISRIPFVLKVDDLCFRYIPP